jgi:hypothetical protein
VNDIDVVYHTHNKDEKCLHLLSGKHEGNKQLRIPKYRWEDNVKMNCNEIMLLVGSYEHITEHSSFIKGKEYHGRLETIKFTKRTRLREIN